MAVLAAQAIIAAGGVAAGTAAATALTIAAVVADLAIVAATRAAAKKKAKDRALKAQLQKDVTVRSGVAPRQIIYGRARSSGPIAYANVTTTAGTDNSSLWFVIPMAGHEVDDIETVWLDGDEITAAQINWGAAAVTGGKYASHVRLYRALGTDTQTVNTALNTAIPGQWTTGHRLRGIAYIVAELILSTAAVEAEVWDRGAPANLRAVIKGKKVYDPRLDSTFAGDWGTGSGAHRVATPSTWEWSDNPALCWADYMIDSRVGRSVPSAAIDYNSVAVAADICDATVSLPASGSEPRYTCNGILLSTDDPTENLAAILSSMMGTMSFVGGQFRVWAGAYVAPTESIGASDIVGNVAVSTMQPRSDRFNEVRTRIIDPDREWQEVEAGIQVNSTIRSGRDNGEVLIREVSLPMVNSDTQAQRIAWKMLLQGDQRTRALVPTNWRGLRVATGDAVSLTLSDLAYSSKAFRCSGLAYDEERGIELRLREDASSAWSDPDTTDYVQRVETGALTIGSLIVPPPSGLTATGVSEGVLLALSQSSSGIAQGILWSQTVIYASPTSAWADAVEVGRVASTAFLHQISADLTRYYWVRNVRSDGTLSARFPDSDTSSVTATSRRVGFADAEYGGGVFVESIAAETVATGQSSLLNWQFSTATVDVITDAASPMGANVIRLNSTTSIRHKRSIAFDPDATYRMTVFLSRGSTPATGTVNLGVIAVDSSGGLIDRTGTATTYDVHRVGNALDVSTFSTTNYTTLTGYISGFGSPNGTNASTSALSTIASPIVMHEDTRRVIPAIAATITGQIEIAGFIFEKVGAAFSSVSDGRIAPIQDDLDNARVVTHSAPQGQTWRSDSSGNYPAGNPSVVLTARFQRNGTEIATQPVTFALTSATGVITRTVGTATGETVSVATEGNGTSQVIVNVTHTASNQTAFLSAVSIDEAAVSSGGGSISK